MDKTKELKDLILRKEKESKVVFMTAEGLMEADLEEFIKQPTMGLLYDLNRDRGTVLTFIEDPAWINNFAVMLVITRLKKYYDKNQF
jgi:hypothetical protein